MQSWTTTTTGTQKGKSSSIVLLLALLVGTGSLQGIEKTENTSIMVFPVSGRPWRDMLPGSDFS